ncbi:MAG: energy-coupling factor ABC transporter permease [Anaerolineales bacterium]|nr:energy-coupling factor ABC transporter permease [Anaerolineales bacterium]MCB9145405.1 energy-coupling factor ABC transporter permease [Anaerolineales bacterium]
MYYSPTPLHIPDGFLSLIVSVICWVITVAILGVAVSKTNKALGEKQIPLMGVMAAFIFAAQMINFPVAGGTSGHMLGGALAAIVLGPWAGMLVMTAVVAVQALLFQDGGLLVMGANILNMGLVTAAIGYGLYRSVSGSSKGVKLGVIGVAAWLSVMAGALLTSLQLWLSGTSQLDIVIPAMLGVHALIGLGEALITVFAVAFIMQTRPDLLGEGSESAKGSRSWVFVGAIISLLVVLLSPLASADPDGLERVATDMGFINAGQSAPYEIIPDYTLPFLGETALSTIFAGVVGVVVVGIIILLVGRGMKAHS